MQPYTDKYTTNFSNVKTFGQVFSTNAYFCDNKYIIAFFNLLMVGGPTVIWMRSREIYSTVKTYHLKMNYLQCLYIYMQDKNEQDSYVNAYYAYLRQNNVDLDSVYNNFPNDENNPYGLFLTFCSYFKQVQYTDEHIREVC